AQSDQKQQERTSPIWQHLWQGSTQDAEDAQLANLNPELIEQNFNETLQKLQTSRAVASLQPVARGRLDALMPRLLEELANTQSPSVTLKRVLPLIETVLRRSAYLLLLKENPSALKQLVQLCSYSPWLASYLTETPLLLDELLNQVAHQPLPDRASLDSELRQRLLRVEPDDLEQQMEQLRQFVRSHVFQAAACEVSHTQPLMLISGYLTNLAESCLTTVMQLAWEQMIRKYGQPVDPQGNLVNEPEFLVIGYGKVGGREMSYSSDLDLVFLHRGWMMGETRADREAGQRSVDIPVFYTRMGQRIIHILTTQTRTGELYEVDMRLRPSGNSGMIVASMKAFDDYQNQHAWTWEHQALVRARVLCGDPKLAEEFQAIRKNVLTQPRDAAELATQVGEMRDRMRTHLGSGKQPERPSDDSPDTGSALEQACSELKFHLKQDAGGIVDIEFLVQYGVLAWAHKNPELLDVTDNVRLLKALSAAGLLDPKDRQTLQDSYLSYRAETHRRALQHRSITLEPHESRAHGFDIRRYRVMRLWDKWLSADSATERTKPQDKSE
ncbi:MAG: bifunctional [glutamate--ammonia ligase]-adenylyl-L-tyrosine phosphorylase/[glutamate--ammonia-ligase] adenylyltransferase, partial [Oceanobacter sp.]